MNERTEPTHVVHAPLLQAIVGPSSSHEPLLTQAHSAPHAIAAPQPDVYAFDEFRAYLTAWFQWKKQVQPHYSGAIFAKKAGFNSHTLLGMVIRGQRNLSATSIRSFCRALGLKGKEATYFEKLVLLNQARNSEDQSYYLEQLQLVSKSKNRPPVIMSNNGKQYLSHWYVVAVRELVAVKGFSADPKWICAQLRNRISAEQAQEAWSLLLSLGLVSQDASGGRWQVVNPLLEVDTRSAPGNFRVFNQECLEIAKDAAAHAALSEHEISTLTMAIDRKDLRKLMDKVYEFRQQLNAEFSVSGSEADQVVAVTTSVVELTPSGLNA